MLSVKVRQVINFSNAQRAELSAAGNFNSYLLKLAVAFNEEIYVDGLAKHLSALGRFRILFHIVHALALQQAAIAEQELLPGSRNLRLWIDPVRIDSSLRCAVTWRKICKRSPYGRTDKRI